MTALARRTLDKLPVDEILDRLKAGQRVMVIAELLDSDAFELLVAKAPDDARIWWTNGKHRIAIGEGDVRFASKGSIDRLRGLQLDAVYAVDTPLDDTHVANIAPALMFSAGELVSIGPRT